MIVEKRKLGEHTLVRVEGIIKLGESAQFLAQTLERSLNEDAGHVFVDLERINYIDSTGIGELVGYLGRFKEQKRRLVLVQPSHRIVRLLEVAQLAELFPRYETLESALDAETN